MKQAVLVIEDDHWVAMYMADVIRRSFNITVFTANTGQDATNIWNLNRQFITAIISDIALPDNVNGETLVCELTKETPELPIIFVTGGIRDKADLAKSLGRSINLLHKPFGPIELQAALKPYIDAQRPVAV